GFSALARHFARPLRQARSAVPRPCLAPPRARDRRAAHAHRALATFSPDPLAARGLRRVFPPFPAPSRNQRPQTGDPETPLTPSKTRSLRQQVLPASDRARRLERGTTRSPRHLHPRSHLRPAASTEALRAGSPAALARTPRAHTTRRLAGAASSDRTH